MSVLRHFSFTLRSAAIALAVTTTVRAAEPFTSATVTRVENKVNYGKVVGDKSETRPASANDVVKANNFLLSETDSRAELKYDDGTIVRIGQNTIFSFDASTRTLNLKQGTFVFSMPKGKGGGTIKTPTFTAAITGTIGKVSTDIIAIIEGEVTLVPSGRKVSEGFFARMNADGTVDILPFDLTKAFDGKLMTFNGALPGLPSSFYSAALAAFEKLGIEGSFETINNLPSAVLHFNGTQTEPPPPPTSDKKKPVPPTATPVTPRPSSSSSSCSGPFTGP